MEIKAQKPISRSRKILIDSLLVVHAVIFASFFVILFLGFFIPSSMWPDIIEIHFLYSTIPFLLFFLWGFIWTVKFRDRLYKICFLDTITQKLRGYSFWDPRNYNHSFIEELSYRLNLKALSLKAVYAVHIISIFITGTIYLLKLKGIIIY